MKITTKFDIGNTVFFMSINEVKSAKVTRIKIILEGATERIIYETEISNELNESKVFKTKNALLKSL